MSHVHFGAVKDRTTIKVEQINDNDFYANLGFLQDQHIYNVRLSLPVKTELMDKCDVECVGEFEVTNVSIAEKDGMSEALLDIKMEGVHGQVQTKFILKSIEPAISMDLRASVLKSHDGTPSLKSGITIVSRLDNDDVSSIASGSALTCS